MLGKKGKKDLSFCKEKKRRPQSLRANPSTKGEKGEGGGATHNPGLRKERRQTRNGGEKGKEQNFGRDREVLVRGEEKRTSKF